MMTRRRPTEPPPIQMALARTGENRRCIECLSLLTAVCPPSLFGVRYAIGWSSAMGRNPTVHHWRRALESLSSRPLVAAVSTLPSSDWRVEPGFSLALTPWLGLGPQSPRLALRAGNLGAVLARSSPPLSLRKCPAYGSARRALPNSFRRNLCLSSLDN